MSSILGADIAIPSARPKPTLKANITAIPIYIPIKVCDLLIGCAKRRKRKSVLLKKYMLVIIVLTNGVIRMMMFMILTTPLVNDPVK
jgi:hypothetical protein